MIIDWYTVIFQIINFLLLVFLLRKFLYRPIIKTMEDREEKILRREEEAEAQARESREEAQAYRLKVTELQERDEELLEAARAQAEKEGLRLLEGARSQVEESRKRWNREVQREKEAFLKELRSQVGRQSCLIARQCLKDLADADLEGMIWDVFLKKLEGLPEGELASLRDALAEEGRVLLASSFEPLKEQLEETTASLADIFGRKAEITHQVDPGLVCGVELVAGGFRAAWSVDEYLEDVEKEIMGYLQQSEKEALPDVQEQ